MNAMVLSAPRPVESTPLQRQEMAIPEPQAGEILLRVRCCGVCHTDLHIVEGEMPPARLPLVPGHQVVAVVERLGPGLTHPAPGSRVGVAWLYASCGACAACRRGDENLCERITFTGYHVNGGYAEYMLARAGYVYPLPASFDHAHAAPLLCAGIIGYRALRLLGARPAQREQQHAPGRPRVPAAGGVDSSHCADAAVPPHRGERRPRVTEAWGNRRSGGLRNHRRWRILDPGSWM